MPIDNERLKQLLATTLGPAKQNLDEYGKVLPVVLIFTEDGRQRTIPVPDKFQVGKTIEKEKPDAFVYVAEAWQRDFTPEEKKLDFSEVQKRIKEGGALGASESPNRREIILLIGGTGSVRVSLEQRFHRDQGKVVFDGVPEMKELKVGDSLVDWKDERAVDSSQLFTTAPIGGRIMRFEQPGFEIWIPEGWKMQWEPNATDLNRTPVWFRERDPHGGLRLRVQTYKGAPTPWDPLGEARKEADARRKREGVESVQLDESRERPLLTCKLSTKGQTLDRPWKIIVFKVFDSRGAIELMWMNQAEMKESETLEELASVKEIANRITRLLP
jgi:hypothetical protein